MEIGKVYSVFIMIFLGCNIYLLDQTTAFISYRTILLITLQKLIICPIVGLYVIKLFLEHQLCTNDPLLIFIYLINFCSPTAINLLTIAATYSSVGDDMAKLLFFQYICYLTLLPFILILFLQ